MNITPDANLLLRAVLKDDEDQAQAAVRALDHAALIAVTLPALCEFVWVLRQRRKIPHKIVASKIRALLSSDRVKADREAIGAGLETLEAGGDFADGVIAYEGRRLGGTIFVTFDKDAALLISKAGADTALLTG